MCVYLNKEDSQGTMTPADNKEERLRKNEGSSKHDGSCIGINYAHRFPKCFRLLHTSHVAGIFALHFVSPIQLFSLYQFIQLLTCTQFLAEIHTAKISCEGLS